LIKVKDKIKLLDLKTSKMVDTIFVWNYKTRFKGQWIEFADLREYEPWDDVKNIDWIVSAKQNKVFVKKYIEERLLKSVFLIDVWSWMNFGIWNKQKKDLLIEIFTMLAFSSVKNGDMVWALLYDDCVIKYFPPKKWKLNVLAIIKTLYDIFDKEDYKEELKKVSLKTYWKLFWTKQSRTLDLAIDFTIKHKLKNSLVFALTDQIKDLNERKLKAIWVKNDFVFINIFDEFENKLNYNWVFNFVDKGECIQINTSNDELRERYLKNRSQKLEKLKKSMRKFRVDYLALDNATNIFSYFYKYFKLKEKQKI